MSGKKKLVYIIHNLGIGGAQRVVLDLARHLDKEKYDISIISLVDQLYLAYSHLSDCPEVKVYTCNAPAAVKFPWVKGGVIKRLYRLLKTIKPDIIHSHLWAAECLHAFLFTILPRRIRWVHTIHTSGGYMTGPTLKDKILRGIEGGVQRLGGFQTVAISKPVFDLAKDRLRLKKVELIYNGVDIDLYNTKKNIRKDWGLREGDVVLIYASRYQESKGHLFLLEAMKMLVPVYRHVKLLLIGEGMKQVFNDYVKENELEEHVIFTGPRNDIPHLLTLADIGVFPSLFEGMPIALCEMMSSGLPVVASDIAAIRDVTMQGKGVILVPPADAKSIAVSIEKLIGDKGVRDKLANEGRRLIVDNFDIQKQIKLHDLLYQKITHE